VHAGVRVATFNPLVDGSIPSRPINPYLSLRCRSHPYRKHTRSLRLRDFGYGLGCRCNSFVTTEQSLHRCCCGGVAAREAGGRTHRASSAPMRDRHLAELGSPECRSWCPSGGSETRYRTRGCAPLGWPPVRSERPPGASDWGLATGGGATRTETPGYLRTRARARSLPILSHIGSGASIMPRRNECSCTWRSAFCGARQVFCLGVTHLPLVVIQIIVRVMS